MRQFLPQSHDFYPDFTAAAAIAAEAATLLRVWLTSGVSEENGEHLRELEHQGDEITHRIHEGLRLGFIPPISREDIRELAHRLDDFLDMIEEAGQRFRLYNLAPGEPQPIRLATIIEQQAQILMHAMPMLATIEDARSLLGHVGEIHRLENEADEVHDQALAHLYDRVDDVPGVIHGRRLGELYALLEAATDKADQVAHVVENIADQRI